MKSEDSARTSRVLERKINQLQSIKRRVVEVGLALAMTACASGPITQPPPISQTDIQNARIHLTTVRPPPQRKIDPRDMLDYIDRFRPNVDPHLLAICRRVFSSNCQTAVSSVRYFVALEDMTINAYQSQDGITFTAGFLYAAGSDDEVIAVWAHEAAHMLYGHLAKAFSNESLYGLAGSIIGIAVADELFVPGTDSDIYKDMSQSGMELGSQWGRYVFSPEMEIEADQFAVCVLKSGGWRIDAGIELIARIHQGNVPIAVSDTGRGWAGLFRTHPPHDVRVGLHGGRGSTCDDNKRNAPDVQVRAATLRIQEIHLYRFYNQTHYCPVKSS